LEDLPDGPVLELCSGVGHIGLLTLLGNARNLVMVDASPVACEYAEANALAAGLAERVTIRRGRLESALGPEERFPLVLADPPWVPTAEVRRFPKDPLSAIDGGDDGLAVTRACLEVIGRHLHQEGVAILQVGTSDQAAAVDGWLRSRPQLRLVSHALREFGDRGVLVSLRRPGGGTC
jgi:release factor glutamine methyltransferase